MLFSLVYMLLRAVFRLTLSGSRRCRSPRSTRAIAEREREVVVGGTLSEDRRCPPSPCPPGAVRDRGEHDEGHGGHDRQEDHDPEDHDPTRDASRGIAWSVAGSSGRHKIVPHVIAFVRQPGQ